jgi:hypothetical protein
VLPHPATEKALVFPFDKAEGPGLLLVSPTHRQVGRAEQFTINEIPLAQGGPQNGIPAALEGLYQVLELGSLKKKGIFHKRSTACHYQEGSFQVKS